MIDMYRLHTVQPACTIRLRLRSTWLVHYSQRAEPLFMDARREARCHRCGTRLAYDNTNGCCAPCRVGSRKGFAAAPKVPAEFWDSYAMREALASRHM